MKTKPIIEQRDTELPPYALIALEQARAAIIAVIRATPTGGHRRAFLLNAADQITRGMHVDGGKVGPLSRPEIVGLATIEHRLVDGMLRFGWAANAPDDAPDDAAGNASWEFTKALGDTARSEEGQP